MILFPAIDLRAGCCVRLTRGLAEHAKIYDEDPVHRALAFAGEGASWIHVVDLDAAMDRGLDNRDRIRAILKAVTLSVQVGGGIRSLREIETILKMGAARVILGSSAV